MDSRAIAVTGATGFVGRRLVSALHARSSYVRALTRTVGTKGDFPTAVDLRAVGAIHGSTDWSDTLRGIGTVIHLASRVHVLEDPAADPLAEYREVNVAGTLRLARAAVEAGVQRFVFVSSVKVNGEETADGAPYDESTPPTPLDPYGVSKWEAETELRQLAISTGLEVVVLRPPLVYGPGVRANFLRLLEAVDRRIPLPLGGVRNRRSLVFVGNLVDAIILAAEHPGAAGETFLVSDGDAVSSAELVRQIGIALKRKARLIPVPPTWMLLAGRLTGREAVVRRLVGSLEVDSGKIRAQLGWSPPFTLAQGLTETAIWWAERRRID